MSKILYNKVAKESIEKFIKAQHFQSRIAKLFNAIRFKESGGKYDAIGLNNEKGAFQFCEDTWKMWSKKLFKRILDITSPIDQDILARSTMEYLAVQGYTDAQIASIWNCGSPNWEGKIGVNPQGVAYNVPNYVTSILKLIKMYQ
jgi:hypothetical protein